MTLRNIAPDALQQLLTEEPSVKVLDVRTPEEYFQLGHIPGSTLIPLHELPMNWRQLDTKAKTVVVCQHGIRSLDASYYLQQMGFDEIYNLMDGMAGWAGPVEYAAAEQH